MIDVVGNCFLCEEKSLHIAGRDDAKVMQCINCGYTTSTKFNGTKETNEEFQKLGEDMKNWAKEENGYIWIPSIITLPIGMLYPMNVENKMKWSFAPMVKISEEDRKNFPNEQGGFYERKIDTDNSRVYDEFVMGMSYITELMKNASTGE